MYKGTKDARLRIKIPQKYCYKRTMRDGNYIEVKIPTDSTLTLEDTWFSFMVRPEQVFYVDDKYNIIDGICRNTKIRLCQHFFDKDGNYKPIMNSMFEADPHEIIKQIDSTIGPVHLL